LGALLLSSCNQFSDGKSAAPTPPQVVADAKSIIAQKKLDEQTWDLVSSDGGSNFYVSPSSYQILNDHTVEILEKVTGKASAPDPATVYVHDYDCRDSTGTPRGYWRLDANGKIVGGAKLEGALSQTTALGPGIIGWAVSQSICKTVGMSSAS
jgi:hypothetical protein